MSFMAGFGQSFSESFQSGIDRHRKQNDDMFKTQFDKYLKNVEENKKAEADDRQDAEKAAALAEMLPGVDRKAATAQIYKMIRSGLDEDYIMEQLEKPGAKIEFLNQVKEEKDSLEQQTKEVMGGGSTQKREQAVGLGASGQQAQPEPEKKKSWRDGFKGGLFGSPYSREERILNRVADAAGAPVDQVKQTLQGQGYTPGKLIDTSNVSFTPGIKLEKDDFTTLNAAMIELRNAEYNLQKNPSPEAQERFDAAQRRVDAIREAKMFEGKAAQGNMGMYSPVLIQKPDGKISTSWISQGPDGTPIGMNGKPIEGSPIRQVDEQEQKDLISLGKSLAEPVRKYNDKVIALDSTLRSANDLADLVEMSGGAVTTRTGSLAQFATSLGAEVAVITDAYEKLKNSDAKVGNDPEFSTKINNMDQRITELIGQGISDLGLQSALYEAKVKILAYKLAAMNGQSGRDLSETERKLFEEIAKGSGGGPEKFMQNLGTILNQEISTLRSEGGIQNKSSSELDAFANAWGWKPEHLIAMDVDKHIQGDPDLKRAHDRFAPYFKMQPSAPGQKTGETPEGSGQMNDPAPVTVNTIEDVAKLPKGTRFVIPDGKYKGQIGVAPGPR